MPSPTNERCDAALAVKSRRVVTKPEKCKTLCQLSKLNPVNANFPFVVGDRYDMTTAFLGCVLVGVCVCVFMCFLYLTTHKWGEEMYLTRTLRCVALDKRY